MEELKKIDSAIKKVWAKKIIKEYNRDYLLMEDSLKNALYYHLRCELTDKFLDDNNIRIYTEYSIDKKKADMAIVKLYPIKKRDELEYHLKDRVENLLAIIELKFSNKDTRFADDVLKIKEYIKKNKFPKCHYYLGFIDERSYTKEIASFLHINQRNSWAKGRVTELTAHYDEKNERFVSDIIPEVG